MKLRLSIFIAIVLGLIFVSIKQVRAGHCNVVYRDCSAECLSDTYDCLASCNQANAALYEQS